MDEPEVHLTPDGASYAVSRDGVPVAQGHLARDGSHWLARLAPSAERDRLTDPDAVGALLEAFVGLAGRMDDAPVWWVVTDADASHDDAAEAAGLQPWRDVHQVRRPLPLEPAVRAGLPTVSTRAFRPGHDESAWLGVNARSFAEHPEQGGRTDAELRELETLPWFDPDGFLLLDADPAGPRAGQLDGFCWTKVHHDHQPPLGEIFVIGVDPSAAGRGLGPALTVAGLDHLAARGLTIAMLYVDRSNTRAMSMYEKLGFRTHHVERIYRT